MFSTFNPDVIEDTVVQHLKDCGIQYTSKEDKYKIKFTIENTDKHGNQSVVGMCLRILKVDDNKNVIEFTKTSGNESIYLNLYKELREASLGKLNDASE